MSKHTEITTHAINLEEDKQLSYGFIYSLEPIRLETLKIYIKTNLANSFICLSQFSTGAPILFDKKLNRSYWLYINYKRIKNITIENQCPLLLASKFFNCLNRVK